MAVHRQSPQDGVDRPFVDVGVPGDGLYNFIPIHIFALDQCQNTHFNDALSKLSVQSNTSLGFVDLIIAHYLVMHNTKF